MRQRIGPGAPIGETTGEIPQLERDIQGVNRASDLFDRVVPAAADLAVEPAPRPRQRVATQAASELGERRSDLRR
jgi:hypothetical protein